MKKKIFKSYYFSFSNPNCRQFYKDAASSATKRGMQMSLRQAVGFLVTELWFSVKDAIKESDGSFKGTCLAIVTGLKNGALKVKTDYRDLFSYFGEGALSGIVSSVTSTVTNIFETTISNTNRIIRQGWASLVEATSILLFNDKDQYLCDRMTSASKVLAAGASVIVGTIVQEEVSIKLCTVNIETELKNEISAFAGCLCTGVMSVSLLFYIDNGPFTKMLTDIYGKGEQNLRKQGELFKQYCAELEKIDIKRLKTESDYIYTLSERLDSAEDQQTANQILCMAVTDLGLPSVFGEHTIDECMQNPNWTLRF